MIDFLIKPGKGFILSILLLTALFIPIFFSDYAYLDEAHQLWHNQDGSNYTMFFVQGRGLTGILMNHLFSVIFSISDFKIVRILSFFSWVLFLEEFFRLGRKWQERIGFDKTLILIGGIYIACCPSVAIYIGWGSCFEVGIASLLGLWSGHLLFMSLLKKDAPGSLSEPSLFLPTLLGLGSLFLYQTAFPCFLLPFILFLLEKKPKLSDRIMKWGISIYVLISLLYYVAFLYSFHHSSLRPNERTDFTIDIPGKLGFFFSAPLAQGFSFNLLYNLHSIPSQQFPILMMVLWVALLIFHNKTISKKNLFFLLVFIGMLMLIYAPLLVGKENFSSYRTMFMLNLTVTIALIHAILSFFGTFSPSHKSTFFLVFLLCFFAAVGAWNFRINFLQPLKKEYSLLDQYFNTHYNPGISTVYVLRPEEDLFYDKFSIHSYKDEFGVPSTFKDWTPEPLIKQFILEKTHQREKAQKTSIVQFTNKDSFDLEAKNKGIGSMYINVRSLF